MATAASARKANLSLRHRSPIRAPSTARLYRKGQQTKYRTPVVS